MSKIEREIKILNVNVEEMKNKLSFIGAQNKGENMQKIYVYDLPTIYYRFLEIRDLINSKSDMIVNTNLKRLKVLLLEISDLIKDSDLKILLDILNINDLNDITNLQTDKIKVILSNEMFESKIKEYYINPNKWIRLRETGNKVELTTKHILEKQNNKFQNVIETEIEVSSIEETNALLESIGISRRSYQEKIRYSFEYKDAQIEIDIWPYLEPYMEIECDNEETINELLEKLKLNNNEIVSLNTEQLYNRIGIDVHFMSELKFQYSIKK